MSVQLPIDHLAELWPADLRGKRVGALLHPASVSSTLVHSSRVLEEHNGTLFELAAFFGPQHGFLGQTQDNMIEWQDYRHPRLGIPVYSLYGEHREPTAAMLSGLDVLLVDLQDIGTRYYTFIWTLYLVMKACAAAGVHVVVCERPNPINGVTTEGPLLDPEYRSFVGLHPLAGAAWAHDWRAGAAVSRRGISQLSAECVADARMGTRDVVRRDGAAVGNAVAEYADARDRGGVCRDVSVRRHEHFRRTRNDATFRDLRGAIHRR
jgi:hypothetical protein